MIRFKLNCLIELLLFFSLQGIANMTYNRFVDFAWSHGTWRGNGVEPWEKQLLANLSYTKRVKLWEESFHGPSFLAFTNSGTWVPEWITCAAWSTERWERSLTEKPIFKSHGPDSFLPLLFLIIILQWCMMFYLCNLQVSNYPPHIHTKDSSELWA